MNGSTFRKCVLRFGGGKRGVIMFGGMMTLLGIKPRRKDVIS